MSKPSSQTEPQVPLYFTSIRPAYGPGPPFKRKLIFSAEGKNKLKKKTYKNFTSCAEMSSHSSYVTMVTRTIHNFFRSKRHSIDSITRNSNRYIQIVATSTRVIANLHSKGLAKLGNIVVETLLPGCRRGNVSQFSRARNICCGSKFCSLEARKCF